ncbi:hypothetical protein [Nodosilinea sp. E11]|uniref:hypothetical protein n=1 Tax=Nodosilinea sp. E11 TaxID=3037479 RepID=UPI00293442E2|nr:hypothetical protein [Nodosilinea sp. E11]WOD38422.1 hypothetical protein RRF56_19625 [Nodosilinea sp. E11]
MPVANASLSTNVVDPNQSWDFTPEPDTFSDEALLDLRYLNEAVAGETGFIHQSADGQDLVAGDGAPMRFWPVNSFIWQQKPAAIAEQARFLAKRGVNLVRWHGQVPSTADQAPLNAIDETAREQLWQLVAAMKQEGIYTAISPYFAAVLALQPHWPVPRDSDNMMGLLFFDTTLQAAYRDWWRALLEPVNPYTGLALKDDPAVALIQLQNEDSLLFWTLQGLQGDDLKILTDQYNNWLKEKYGSLDQALRAWQNVSFEGDDLAQGQLALGPIWMLTQPVEDPSKAQRLADQTEFLTLTMTRFNADMVRFLREELGVKSLINANNWKTADPARLNDAERYSYTPAEVIAVNRYYNGVHTGEHSGWAIVNGDRFTDPSVLFHPDQLPTNLKQVKGHPMLITESSWVPPLSYQSEGPFLVSLFQSLTGIDGFFWFGMDMPQWKPPASANGYLPALGKWIADTPELLGNFPAAALMYRQGYIKTGEPVIQEHRSLEALWQRQLPIIAESATFDPNRDRGQRLAAGENEVAVNPLAFLVGPVQVTYSDNPAPNQSVDLAPYIDETAKTVTSITQEITWDYGRGLCWLNSPKAQGVTGFLQAAGPLELTDIAVSSGNHYATVLAVSMDDQPLDRSRQILLQVGTTARPTGWSQTPVQWQEDDGTTHRGYEVTDYGKAPWQISNADVNLTLRNPAITEAQVLDMNGMSQGLATLQRHPEGVTIAMPTQAKYVMLKASEP